jgi:pyruvate/2-oxoglutarate dehydrogenase complex dihydrolipoamide dehydrogenase (E3) component
VRVGDRTIAAERIVINTGARPARPPIDGLNEVDVLNSTAMLDLDQVSESLAVIGGGYVGCEYALMYSRFGTDVTIIQRGERLLPREGPDISTVIEEVFKDGHRSHRNDDYSARRDS